MESSIRIWGAPACLAGVTAVGLTSALVADGWADVLSWLSLVVPVAIMIWCILKSDQDAEARPPRTG